jgi:hypothetical protein
MIPVDVFRNWKVAEFIASAKLGYRSNIDDRIGDYFSTQLS